MDNVQRLKVGSEFGNILAYDPGKAPPPGFEKRDDLSKHSESGLDITTYYNEQTNQVMVAIAGTNDSKDRAAWTSIESAGSAYSGNKVQIDEALALFKSIKKFAESKEAYVMTAGHSFSGAFIDIGAATFGFEGVKFDAVGGGNIIGDAAYQQKLVQMGIVPPPNSANVISATVNGFLGYGGGIVSYFGADLPGTTQCQVTTDRSATSALNNLLGYMQAGIGGYFVSMLDAGVYVHDASSINAAIQDGSYQCVWEPPTVPGDTGYVPSFDDVLNLDYVLTDAYNNGYVFDVDFNVATHGSVRPLS
jgi:hypothetical protein